MTNIACVEQKRNKIQQVETLPKPNQSCYQKKVPNMRPNSGFLVESYSFNHREKEKDNDALQNRLCDSTSCKQGNAQFLIQKNA